VTYCCTVELTGIADCLIQRLCLL